MIHQWKQERDYSCVQLPSITFINQIHTCLPLLTSRHVQCKSLDRNLIRLTYLCCHSLQLVLRMYCQWASGNWFWTQWTNVTMKCKVLPATNAGSIPWQHAIVNVPFFPVLEIQTIGLSACPPPSQPMPAWHLLPPSSERTQHRSSLRHQW